MEQLSAEHDDVTDMVAALEAKARGFGLPGGYGVTAHPAEETPPPPPPLDEQGSAAPSGEGGSSWAGNHASDAAPPTLAPTRGASASLTYE